MFGTLQARGLRVVDVQKKVSTRRPRVAHGYYQSRWPIYSAIVNVVVFFRVLHKGSIPMGQLISPKTTHTNNMATWSDMSMSGRCCQSVVFHRFILIVGFSMCFQSPKRTKPLPTTPVGVHVVLRILTYLALVS